MPPILAAREVAGSIWGRIVHTYRALQVAADRAADRRRRLDEFRRVASAAVADRAVTVDEIDALQETQRRLELTDTDLQAIRGEAIRQALRTATEDKRLSPEETRSLQQMADRFRLPADRAPRTARSSSATASSTAWSSRRSRRRCR